MSADTRGNGRAEMTLAFELSALKAFESPGDVFADARRWSRHVGVVANDTEAVASYVREHDLRQDFDLGGDDKWLAMEGIRARTDTDRHVFVATEPEDRRLADHLGWEFVHRNEAAKKAGWTLANDTDDEPGFVDRLRSLLPTGSR